MSEINKDIVQKQTQPEALQPEALQPEALQPEALQPEALQPAQFGYWKSLAQWNQDSEFQKAAAQEFQSSPLREEELTEEDRDGGWARREFLKLMGASLAMASTACIRRPVQKIVPYNKAVEEITFGLPNYYTSSYFDGAESLGLLVKTREGRPIKIDGNPKHPLNGGASSTRAQGSILSLYDPERLHGPRKISSGTAVETTWAEADASIVAQLQKGGVVVLTGALNSPATTALVKEFTQGFKAKHVQYEALSSEEIREGQKASYGDEAVPFYHFEKAKIIVSVDADFLGTWLAPTAFTRQFAAGRKDPATMNKLVSFDSNYSLTGANADIRVKIKPSQQVDVVMGLAHEIVVKKGASKFAAQSSVKSALAAFAETPTKLGISHELFSRLAEDLWKHKGQSLIVAGGLVTQTEAAKDLQVAVNFLNSVLENDGATVDGRSGFSGLKASTKAIFELIEEMKKGSVKTLVIHGVNPNYTLPSAAGFREAVKNVGMIISSSDRVDETGTVSSYVLPDNHPMESWGDAEIIDGVYTIQQPTIRPMYDTRSFQLSLMTWAKIAKVGGKRISSSDSYYDYVQAIWKDEIYSQVAKAAAKGTNKAAGFESFWDQALQTGVVDLGKQTKSSPARTFKLDALNSVKAKSASGLELVLYPTVNLGDGRFANISWLQELPDPVSKICWDNFAAVSLATAEKLQLKEKTLVELVIGGRSVKIPLYIQPGLHNDVVTVAIGYGRTAAGKIANNVGVNAFDFAKIEKGALIASGLIVELKPTQEAYKLACVAGNATMEGRKIVAEATLTEYLKEKGANNHRHKTFSIWSGHQYNGNKWGMAVDLNSCTGCSACMIACQAENNIPVVGKKYVLQGREMHWMRVDRYYVGNPENAEAVFQPVMCQQCDNAPCETVCPVLATVHSSEGLNDMTYNRCVGTRYCSNNCPYKVRRFNWFNFTGPVEKPLNLQYNPDVTVRPRGVMEKCTFCVHRIKAARNQSRLENRELKEGDIQTACEQVCPAKAIIFGDLNDPESRVAKIFKEEPRAYGLLEEFNAAPAVRYLTKIRNNDQEKRFPGTEGASHNKGGHA